MTDIKSEKMTRRRSNFEQKKCRPDIKSFFNTTTDIKSFFQADLKSADVVSFLKHRHKVRKNDTIYADIKSENFFRHCVIFKKTT
jgi:hypothetical protein